MKLIKNAVVFRPEGTLKKQNIEIEHGRIKALTEEAVRDYEEVIDARDLIVAPGFVDIHIHGAVGSDFSDGSKEDIDRIAGFLITQGVTSYLGTTMSLGEHELAKIMEAAAPLVGKIRENRAVLRGINMEGPFISRSKKGGQNGEFIINPDYGMFEHLYQKSGCSIRLIDIAPELEGSMDFINKVKESCRVSLAHTEADYEMAKSAFENGASHVTHLFNAMPPINHRNPGMMIAAMEDASFVEIICDGIHLHPAIVRFAFRMFGRDRVCIVSDSMRACGLKDGEYLLGGQTVYVKDGRAVLKDGTLAGSTTSVTEAFRRAVQFGIPIEEALQAVTLNPAKAAGLEHTLGSLQPGNLADIIILNKELKLVSVFLKGTRVQ